MHQQVKDYLNFIKINYPNIFENKKVLDVGSGDINGNNRYLFKNCEYNGNDVCKAPNVTIVSKTKDLPFEDESFDLIISTECFEHDVEYKESLKKIYKMLKKGGIFIFTCASYGRPEHGTRRTTPHESYGTISNDINMSDYYKNLVKKDISEIYNLKEDFINYNMYYQCESKDLYFIGIKNDNNYIELKKYDNDFVFDITEEDINYEVYLKIYDNLKRSLLKKNNNTNNKTNNNKTNNKKNGLKKKRITKNIKNKNK